MWTPDALYRWGVCIAPAAAACLLLLRWPCCVCMLPGVIVRARACVVMKCLKCNAGGMQMCMGLRHARTHTQEGGKRHTYTYHECIPVLIFFSVC